MFRNYLKIAVRNLLKHKLYSDAGSMTVSFQSVKAALMNSQVIKKRINPDSHATQLSQNRLAESG